MIDLLTKLNAQSVKNFLVSVKNWMKKMKNWKKSEGANETL